MKNRTLRQITAAGVIAAAYAAISLVLAPITFGAVQCRVSEALTLLPVLSRCLGRYPGLRHHQWCRRCHRR